MVSRVVSHRARVLGGVISPLALPFLLLVTPASWQNSFVVGDEGQPYCVEGGILRKCTRDEMVAAVEKEAPSERAAAICQEHLDRFRSFVT